MRRLLSPLALALLGLAGTSAMAAERHWTYIGGCGSADWFGKPNGLNAEGKSTCWAASAGGASGQAVPGADDRVYIHHANAAADLVNTFSFAHDGAPRLGWADHLSIAGTNGRYAALAVGRDTLHVSNQLTVGDLGLGKLVQTGGLVKADVLALGQGAGSLGRVELSGGDLQVSSGGSNNWYSGLWVGFGGRGQFVQSGGSLTSVGMSVAETGPAGAGSGTFFDLSGGSAAFSGFVFVGADTPRGSSASPQGGRLRISGTGSMSAFRLNLATVGLLVMDGGSLRLQELSAEAGSLSLNGGLLEFTGAAHYGRVTASPETWTPLPLTYGGGVGGGTPTVRLAPGSTLSLPALQVGDFGKGRLEVFTGAVLTTGSAGLGTSKQLVLGLGTGEGSAWVAGATWINTGHLALGTKGVAQLDVLEGGKLRSGSAALGDGIAVDPSLGRNLARITGSGSEWKNTGDLWVGGGATGAGRASDLWVSDSALLQVGGTLTVHAGSSLIVDGGTWTAAHTVIQGAIDIVSTGELQVAGALSLGAGSRLGSFAPLSFRGAVNVASGARIDSDYFMRFEGPVTLHTGGPFVGEGTLVFAGGLSPEESYCWPNNPTICFTAPGSVSVGPGTTVFAASNVYTADLFFPYTGTHDRLVSSGQIVLGGTLKLMGGFGYAGQAGASFDLFDGALSGSFAHIDTSGIALSAGLAWDFSRLHTEGVVSLTAAPIPEPGTWALWLAGLAGFGVVARRRPRR